MTKELEGLLGRGVHKTYKLAYSNNIVRTYESTGVSCSVAVCIHSVRY